MIAKLYGNMKWCGREQPLGAEFMWLAFNYFGKWAQTINFSL